MWWQLGISLNNYWQTISFTFFLQINMKLISQMNEVLTDVRKLVRGNKNYNVVIKLLAVLNYLIFSEHARQM